MYLYQSQSIQCTKSSQLKLQIYLADTTTINIQFYVCHSGLLLCLFTIQRRFTFEEIYLKARQVLQLPTVGLLSKLKPIPNEVSTSLNHSRCLHKFLSLFYQLNKQTNKQKTYFLNLNSKLMTSVYQDQRHVFSKIFNTLFSLLIYSIYNLYLFKFFVVWKFRIREAKDTNKIKGDI